MPSFDFYFGVINPIQQLRHYQEKIAIYSHDDLLTSWVFPSSLKEVTSDWFYSLLSHLFSDFEEVRKAFYNQFASRREFKKSNNHLLTIKMKPGRASSSISVIFRAKWLWCITAMTMWMPPRSSVG